MSYQQDTPSPLYVKDLYSNREDCKTKNFERKLEGTSSFGPSTLPQLYHVNDICHVHVMKPVDMRELDENAECNICEAVILGNPCKCQTCSFQTHHFCAELAQQSRHRLHRNHVLTLLPNSPAAWCRVTCDVCREDIKGFNLFCRICSFIMDISCALKGRHSLGVLGQKVIRTWRRRCMTEDHSMIEVIISRSCPTACIVCDERVNGKGLSCMECEEIYHFQCFVGKEDFILTHPLHPDHCLEFSLKRGSKCIACKLNITKYCYSCSSCEFNFHIGCIKAVNVSQEFWSHSHCFYNFWMDNLRETRVCSVCGRPCDASFYGCTECEFKSHEECLGFPSIVKNLHHHHSVVIAYDSVGDKSCSLCGSQCSDRSYYSCSYCKEVFHKKCIMSMVKIIQSVFGNWNPKPLFFLFYWFFRFLNLYFSIVI